MTDTELTALILGSAIAIHKEFGPGLLESAYKALMAHDLRSQGLKVQTEVPVPLKWRGVSIRVGYRADMLVEGRIVVELKSVEVMPPVYKKQLLTHLRVLQRRVGLLINFGQQKLMDGVERIVNGYE